MSLQPSQVTEHELRLVHPSTHSLTHLDVYNSVTVELKTTQQRTGRSPFWDKRLVWCGLLLDGTVAAVVSRGPMIRHGLR